MARETQIKKKYLVFISHSTRDRWIARQMAAMIEEKGREYGVMTFLDERDIAGGDSIPDSIRKNIQGVQRIFGSSQ